MSMQPKHLKLTTDQRKFVMDRLLLDIPYAEIIEEFERMYSHVFQAFDSEVLRERLHGQLRKMKHEGLDTESESGSEAEMFSSIFSGVVMNYLPFPEIVLDNGFHHFL